MKKNHFYLYGVFIFCGFCLPYSASAQLAINPYPLAEKVEADSFVPLETVRAQVPSQESLVGVAEDDPLEIAPRAGTSVSKPSADAVRFPVYIAPEFEEQKPVAEPVYQFEAQSAGQDRVDFAHGDWTAFKGSNLQDVMRHWSKRSGVEVIWNSYADYEVKDNLEMSGDFEDAVQDLLSQFNLDYIRPIGNLHVDPSSGQKTLVVLTYQGT